MSATTSIKLLLGPGKRDFDVTLNCDDGDGGTIGVTFVCPGLSTMTVRLLTSIKNVHSVDVVER